MIGYVTLGTNKLAEASRFYDELFATIGAGRVFEAENFVAYSTGPTAPIRSARRRTKARSPRPCSTAAG